MQGLPSEVELLPAGSSACQSSPLAVLYLWLAGLNSGEV